MPCSDCVFWESPDQERGDCRKDRPDVFWSENGSPVTFWPSCVKGNWCGEWSDDPDDALGKG